MQKELNKFIAEQKLNPKDESESMKGYLTKLLKNINYFNVEQKATLIALSQEPELARNNNAEMNHHKHN